MEPFYAFSISIVTNHFHTFNSTLQHFKKASVAICETRTRVADNFCTKKLFCICTISKVSQFDSAHRLPRASPMHLPNARAPNLRRPCPIFLKTAVSGESPLTCDPSCGRCVGRRNLQQVPPDEAWSAALCAWAGVGVGEATGVMLTREQGAPYRLSDWRVQTSKQAMYKIILDHFSSLTFLRSKELMNGWMLWSYWCF